MNLYAAENGSRPPCALQNYSQMILVLCIWFEAEPDIAISVWVREAPQGPGIGPWGPTRAFAQVP